jgi:hypothetical protein
VEAIHVVEDGNITSIPSLTAADVCRVYDLCGTPPGFVHGRMTQKVVTRALVDDSLIMDEKSQCFFTDIMHIDANKLLVTVTDPLKLTLATHIE